MSKHKKPDVQAAPEKEGFVSNLISGSGEAAIAAGVITGTVALVKAVTNHELSPSEMFLISVLGPGVAHAVTEGTMKFVDKLTSHGEQPKKPVKLVATKKFHALIEAEAPKQLPAPVTVAAEPVAPVVLKHGAKQEMFPEGASTTEKLQKEPAKVDHAAQAQQHRSRKHKNHPGH